MTGVPQTTEWVDPRIRRTRLMLEQSLERLLEKKSFEKISVGEIAEQATLNRATFYDHYPDKFALLEGLASTRFQELLDQRHLIFDGQCSGVLLGISLAMCDYLSGLPGIQCPERRQLDKHFESALMAVVQRMMLAGFSRVPPPGDTSPELLAATISGAIYGAVSHWVRKPVREPAEDLAKSIYSLVAPLLAPSPASTPPPAR